MAYHRILLKLSGEALSAGSDGLYNHAFLDQLASVCARCVAEGVQLALIVGAGNIWRGRQGRNMDPTRADSMGMLATCINAIMLQDSLIAAGVDARVMTAVEMKTFAEYYTRAKAVSHLEKGRVVIFGAGLGSPFFSTDTAAALRAAEIGADAVLMAKNIDGIYTADPKTDSRAKKIDTISCREILSSGLHAIDSTAAAFCMDARMPIHVFGLDDPENIYRVVMGDALGTTVTPE